MGTQIGNTTPLDESPVLNPATSEDASVGAESYTESNWSEDGSEF